MKYLFGIIGLLIAASSFAQIAFEQTINANEQDAEQVVATMDLNNVVLTFGYKDDVLRYTALRFLDIEIPKDSEILTAYIQFWAGANSVTENRSFSVYGHDTAYSLPFTLEDNDIYDRVLTSSSVLWEPGPWIFEAHGENQKTPNLAPVIQEIIANDGWEAGNPLTFILQGSSPDAGYVQAIAYDEIGITFAAKLTVTYQEASGIEPHQAIVSWGIQPNPATNNFSIHINSSDRNPVSVSLADRSGKEIQKLFNGSIHQTNGILSFDISQLGLGKGVYFIRLTQDQTTQVKKLVIY